VLEDIWVPLFVLGDGAPGSCGGVQGGLYCGEVVPGS
jgi:hypothetical protein